jgi:hypothetical protein
VGVVGAALRVHTYVVVVVMMVVRGAWWCIWCMGDGGVSAGPDIDIDVRLRR